MRLDGRSLLVHPDSLWNKRNPFPISCVSGSLVCGRMGRMLPKSRVSDVTGTEGLVREDQPEGGREGSSGPRTITAETKRRSR